MLPKMRPLYEHSSFRNGPVSAQLRATPDDLSAGRGDATAPTATRLLTRERVRSFRGDGTQVPTSAGYSGTTPLRRRLLIEGDLKIASDSEWYSKPVRLTVGTRYEITLTALRKFYAGFFHAKAYAARKGAVAGMFDFPFGSDRRAHYFEGTADVAGDWYVVIRVGGWTSDTTVSTRMIFIPPEASVA